MASDSAWSQGWQTGASLAAGERARKQALIDEERQLKVSDWYGKATALAKTIPSLSGDAKTKAMSDLTDIEDNIKQTYHPDKNPGALQKDWHLLAGLIRKSHNLPPPVLSTTSQAGTPETTLIMPDQEITLPGRTTSVTLAPGAGTAAQQPTTVSPDVVSRWTSQATLPATSSYKTVAPNQGAMTPQQLRGQVRRDEARKMAEVDVEAAGLTPAQEQVQKQDIDEQSRAWQIDWAKRHGISGEALDEFTQHLAGVPTIKSKLKPLTGTKPYKGSDGRYYQSVQDQETGEITAQAMPENYVPPPPSAGPVRAWKRDANGKIISVLLDRQTNKPIPGTENSDLLPPPYLTDKISTGVYHFVDEDNQVHEIPETRTSGPALGGGGQAGARSSGAGAAPSGAVSPAAPRATATPKAPAAAPTAAGATPVVKGDKVIGVKGSAPLNKARSSYGDAVKIANLADDLVADHNSEKDALFVLALIRSEAGRVNQQEINQLFNAGGITEAPERWAAKYGHGELPQTLRLQLQNFAHAQVKSAQAAVDALRGNPADLRQKAKDNVDAGTSDKDFLQKVQ